MKLGISILFVKDVAKAKAFYVNKLGIDFIPPMSNDTFLTLKLEDDMLIGIQDIKTNLSINTETFKTGSNELGFEVKNIDEVWTKFKNMDLVITEIEEKPFGKVFYTKDPEGHYLSFYKPSFK